MKILAVFFIFFGYGLFVTMYEQGTSTAAEAFPSFDAPEIDFEDIPPSCGGFTDCLEYIGKVIINLVLGVVYFVLLVVEILVFLVELTAVLTENAITGFNGAPAWFNVLMTSVFAAIIAVIIFKSLRKGEPAA